MEGLSDTEKLSKTQIRKIASKYKKLIDFREKESKAVGRAKYLGIYKEITKSMVRGPLVKWDLKSLKSEAKKYKRIKDFVKKSKSAYTTMMRLGVKNEVAPHLYLKR